MMKNRHQFATTMSWLTRTRWSIRFVVVLVLVFCARRDEARACSLAGPLPHVLDPIEQRDDIHSPSVPRISAVKVTRGKGPSGGGCGGTSVSSCDDLGLIAFHVMADDDRTPASALGYQLSLARGNMPVGLIGIGQTTRAQADGALLLTWIDGATDQQEDLDFDIEVRAVDLAGNISLDAATVPVRDRNTACGVGRRGDARSGIVFGLFLLAIAGRRRRGTSARGTDSVQR